MSPNYLKSSPISGCTRVLAVDQEEYVNLEIRDETMSDGANCMVSKWTPTPEQLAILNGGGSIYLGIMGEIHPPVVLATALTDQEG